MEPSFYIILESC